MGPALTQWEVLKKDVLIPQNQINSLTGIWGECSYKQHEGISDLGQSVEVQASPAFLFQSPRSGRLQEPSTCHQREAWPELTPWERAPPQGCLACPVGVHGSQLPPHVQSACEQRSHLPHSITPVYIGFFEAEKLQHMHSTAF